MHTKLWRTAALTTRLIFGTGLATCFATAMAQAATPAGASNMVKAAPTQAKPVWPNNGIAQRKAPVATNMFVENDNGHWHAWVLYGFGDATHPQATALDFFTGKTMPVTEDVDKDTGNPLPEFTDAQGNYHAAPGESFESKQYLGALHFSLKIYPPDPSRLQWSKETISMSAKDMFCSGGFMPINGGYTHESPNRKWSKILIHRQAPNSACPYGDYLGGIEPVLDLGDGTFLAVAGCHAVRLRIDDLEPVGKAPAIRIVDAAAMRKAMQAIQGTERDPTAYLDRTLHLNIDNVNSCH